MTIDHVSEKTHDQLKLRRIFIPKVKYFKFLPIDSVELIKRSELEGTMTKFNPYYKNSQIFGDQKEIEFTVMKGEGEICRFGVQINLKYQNLKEISFPMIIDLGNDEKKLV